MKPQKKKVKKTKKKNTNKKVKKNINKKVNKRIDPRKKKLRAKILKWTCLIVLIITAFFLVLLSDLFNIKEINVKNNNRISSEEIIKLSGINTNENMFKFLKIKAKEGIKENPYVENVKIHRKFNKIIEIDVEERVPTFMIVKEEEIFYINNQGYILEKSNERIETPIIEGITSEDLTPGNRLDLADLKKLNTIIQIMQSANIRQIGNKITSINVESINDYIIKMESEQKVIHFGNDEKINDKIIKIIPVLEDNQGVSGEIFVEDINKVYFRGDV